MRLRERITSSEARRKGVCMEQVVGIGGVFFKARDPKALAAWYREHLGVPVEPEHTYGAFTSAAAGEQAVWSAFPADTSYFGSGPPPWFFELQRSCRRPRQLSRAFRRRASVGSTEAGFPRGDHGRRLSD